MAPKNLSSSLDTQRMLSRYSVFTFRSSQFVRFFEHQTTRTLRKRTQNNKDGQKIVYPSSTSISTRHVVLPERWGFCDDANSPSTWNERAWQEHRNLYMPPVPQLENNILTTQPPPKAPKPITSCGKFLDQEKTNWHSILWNPDWLDIHPGTSLGNFQDVFLSSCRLPRNISKDSQEINDAIMCR